jgi:predicted phage terminase large subunit-like protein
MTEETTTQETRNENPMIKTMLQKKVIRSKIQDPGSALREVRAEMARRSFRDFIRLAWPVVEPARRLIPAWHMDAIADHLQAVSEGQIRKLLINIPPGHGKSLIVGVLWPAWQWIRTPQGAGWRGLFGSYDFGLATRDSLRCRALIESRLYRDTFRPAWNLSDDQNEKSYFANTESGFRISLSVGGRGTGFRGDAIIVDDPLNASDQHSESARNDVVFWWGQSMSSRLNDPETGSMIVIMQRLHELDLSGHILEQGNYEHLCLPSEFEPGRRSVTSIGWQDPRTEEGALLFPELYPPSVLEQAKKDLGAAGYAGQHQQRPSPPEGGMLQRQWWRFWKPAGLVLPPIRVRFPDGSVHEIHAIDLPETFDRTIQSWDCAFKDHGNSDYVAGLVISAKGSGRYVRDLVRRRMDMPATVHALRALTAKYPNCGAKLVEDKANGPAVIQSLKNEISGLIEVNPEGGKMSRAAAVSPEVEAGNWHLPHPGIAPWVWDFIEECASFPNGAHDDQVDAFSQGGNHLRRPAVEPNIRFFNVPFPTNRGGVLYSALNGGEFGDYLRRG